VHVARRYAHGTFDDDHSWEQFKPEGKKRCSRAISSGAAVTAALVRVRDDVNDTEHASTTARLCAKTSTPGNRRFAAAASRDRRSSEPLLRQSLRLIRNSAGLRPVSNERAHGDMPATHREPLKLKRCGSTLQSLSRAESSGAVGQDRRLSLPVPRTDLSPGIRRHNPQSLASASGRALRPASLLTSLNTGKGAARRPVRCARAGPSNTKWTKPRGRSHRTRESTARVRHWASRQQPANERLLSPNWPTGRAVSSRA
jgi:hypothetical protein